MMTTSDRFQSYGLLESPLICSSSKGTENMCCDISKDGKWIACGDSGGTVDIYLAESGKLLYRLHDPQFQHLPVTSVKFKNDDPITNLLLASYSYGCICVWHFTSQKCLTTLIEERQTLNAAYAHDCKYFASVGSDRAVLVYSDETNQIASKLEPSMDHTVMDGHMSRVFGLQFHPSDHRILLTAGWDDTVQFWDIRQRHSTRKIIGPHVCGEALDIEPYTLSILTGSWRLQSQVEIWDYATGKLLKTLQPTTLDSKVYCCKWLSHREVLVGGSLRNMSFVITTETDEVVGQLGPLQHGVYSTAYCGHTKTIVNAAGSDLYINHHDDRNKSTTFITQEM